MLDVSDGLVADARHIAEASGVALEIEQARVPLSPAAAAAVAAEPALWPAVLTGGDDYELLFAAPPGATPVLDRIARETGVAIAEIGSMRVGHGVGVLDSAGRTVALAQSGWRHF
jgi:thiamine-monophosphate kinase